MHLYTSLLVKIFDLNEHIPNISFQHLLREGNCCADFLTKLVRSSRVCVTLWQAPPSKLESMLSIDAPD